MQLKEENGVKWLEFDLLTSLPRLKHGVFLRHGGYSLTPYSSLNLGPYVGDDPVALAANQKIVKNILQLPSLVWAYQEHGTKISTITNPQHSPQYEAPHADALATSKSGIGLMIGHADCQAAIFYDPVHHAVVNVHAGWRGSVLNIYAEAIVFMHAHYGSQPQDLLVCISPSLGPQDAQFVNYQTELPQSFWEFQVKPAYFDFWAISTMQLLEKGILPQHIEIAQISTYSHSEDYFSYRRERITGRHGTVVMLL
jgi:hypothetical protein